MPRSPCEASAGWTNSAGGAGGGERGGDLARDMAGLAHAGDHHATGGAASRSTARPNAAVSPAASACSPAASVCSTERATIEVRRAIVASGWRSCAPLLTGGGVRVNLNDRHPTRTVPILRNVTGSMRENVRLLVAQQVEPGPGRQEGEAGLGQLQAPLADQQRLQLRPQGVQMQHVGGGVGELLGGQLRPRPSPRSAAAWTDRPRAAPCTGP